MYMLRNILSTVALCCSVALAAQGITAAEYFWDTDPGVGNGLALSAVDGNFGGALEQVLAQTGSLPAQGPHRLGIRARDVNNNWGPVFSTVVIVEPSLLTAPEINITVAEYFWDTDPGAGNGLPMLAFDGNFNSALEQVMVETTTLPSVGSHVLNIRARDANNAWGPVFSAVMSIEPSIFTAPEINITVAEYFWDNDPGAGNGLPMLAFDGNFNSALEQVMVETATLPAVGSHVLGMRARDVNNAWGPAFRVVVDVLNGAVSFPEIRITAAEYYLNEGDPGPGNATPMIAVDGNFDGALEAMRGGGIPAPVNAGANVLWLRARDASGAWGPSFGIVVNIDTTIAGTVDVPEFVHDRNVVLLPNPTTAESGFIIRFSEASHDVRVVLMDAAGKQVAEYRSTSGGDLHVPLSGHARGMYHVGIFQHDARPVWRKLLVQ
jgi:hypothetical protein